MALLQRYLVFIGGLCLAAVPAAAESEVANKVSVRFNVFALQPPGSIGYHARPEAALTPLGFFTAARSSEYQYTGEPEIEFYEIGGNAVTPVAVWQVPPRMTNALLLFSPNVGAAVGKPKYCVIAVDDGGLSVPAGYVAILNVSGREYRAQICGHNATIRPGMNPAIPATGVVYVELSAEINGRTRVVGGHQFEVGTSERSIVLIFAPVRKTSIQPILRHVSSEVPKAAVPIPR